MLYLLGDKLWWADQGTDQIGTCDKKDGGNWKVLRNSTSPMMHMKIYNETVQKGAGLAVACQRFPKLIEHLFWLNNLAKKGRKYVLVLLRGCLFI